MGIEPSPDGKGILLVQKKKRGEAGLKISVGHGHCPTHS